ncbi:MAG TPA: glycosyltransferase, partial [Flavisolibacter sp.]|nr:glycosyltransferase [Flavisolibacter sp.]
VFDAPFCLYIYLIMAIPKVILQTFERENLPFINRWFIQRLRNKNKGYDYQFYDARKREAFIEAEFPGEPLEAYRKIQIGAAKADFFRYLFLYKKGGVYVDLDGQITKKLNEFLLPDDVAVISHERNPGLYLQGCLMFAPGHPFMKKTIEMVLENIRENKYPYDVHRMTGPTVYSNAIKECLAEDPTIPHRVLGVDYNGYFKSPYPGSKLFLYKKGERWKEVQKQKTVLKP